MRIRRRIGDPVARNSVLKLTHKLFSFFSALISVFKMAFSLSLAFYFPAVTLKSIVLNLRIFVTRFDENAGGISPENDNPITVSEIISLNIEENRLKIIPALTPKSVFFSAYIFKLLSEKGMILLAAYTISNQNGPVAARGHNIRDPRSIRNQLHILPNGEYSIWTDEAPRQAYKRIFGASVKKYNAEQRKKGHPEREISNYYNSIATNKQKNTVYEVIITVGNRDNKVDDEVGKAIMQEFVDDWKERNPSLELIGAYYHADEYDPETGIFGTPHVHIDYVPVAHNCDRGMETQNSLTGALKEMGYVSEGYGKTSVIKWQRSERAELERICHKHGIEVEEKKKEKRRHLDTETYKKVKEAERRVDILNNQATELNDEINKMLDKRNDIGDEIDELVRDLEVTSARLDKLKAVELTPEEASKVRPTYFGDMFEVGVREFESLRRTAIEAGEEKAKRRKTEEEKERLEEENHKLQKELEEIRTSLYSTSENFRHLGICFQTYIDYIKDVNPELADLATQAAIEAVDAEEIGSAYYPAIDDEIL